MKEIPLSKGKVALVDDEDYEWLIRWKWHYGCATENDNKSGYAMHDNGKHGKLGNKRSIRMHHIVLGCESNIEIDHIDGNTLNNQKYNLRPVTHQQNSFNRKPNRNHSSKYKGVVWSKQHGKWRSRIRINQQLKHLGYFTDENEAALAYNKAAFELFGEYARLNQIEGDLAC
jgi:hypothetical protein